MTHRVVFLDRASLKAKVRKPKHATEYVEYQKTAAEEIVPRLTDAEVAIVNKVPMRAPTLEKLPKLKLIAVAATGYDVWTLRTARRTASRSPISATTRSTRSPNTLS